MRSHFAPRLVDLPTERNVRPQHSGPLVAVRRQRRMDAIAAGDQHAQRGVEIFALEIAVESVGEQHDFPRARIFFPCV